jgi:hypothetical protein
VNKKILIAAVWLLPVIAHPAQVMMKDGKVYQGKIIAETDGDILIKTSPVSRSKLLLSQDILSVVRDPAVEAAPDPQRYASLEMLLAGHLYSTRGISLNSAPGLRLGGGLRFHPLVELGAGLEWTPQLSGELAVTDGATLRRYESFYSYAGGFTAKLYPLYKRAAWKAEPFLLVGYDWLRFVPKDSGDALKGTGLSAGVGTAWPLGKRLFWDTRFLYQRVRYKRIFFLLREGTIDPPVRSDSFVLSTGLSLRF